MIDPQAARLEREYWERIYKSRPDNWPTTLAKFDDPETRAERIAAFKAQREQAHRDRIRAFVMEPWNLERFNWDTEEKIEFEIDRRYREEARLAEEKAAKDQAAYEEELAKVLPEVELNWVEANHTFDRQEMLDFLKQTKRTNKDVQDWLKTFPKDARFQVSYEEERHLLQLICEKPYTRLRVALLSGKPAKTPRYSYHTPKWWEHTPGTFNDAIKGVERGET